ncbi:MAG TPA: tyrosine-type recombinase/integrase [Candidatus Sulfotelmatobacter sp.]|jgi:integrase/recombinase XerD
MLSNAVNTYLSVRRALGFKLKTVEGYLRSYADFATARGDIRVVSNTSIEWAGLATLQSQRANRLNVVIRFARFARAEDSCHEIPPANIFCGRRYRRTPYIFTDEEVQRLMLHSARLGPPGTLRPHTYSTLFGLLASTGLRISEALSLRFDDVTPEGLVIRETKFRKSRLVALHETAALALRHYLLRRGKFANCDDHVFVSCRGGKLSYKIAATTFQEVLKAAGVQGKPNGPKPRLHDFRHRFAVKALQACPDGRDRVTRHMLALSTYMGHACLRSTYWYLESTPQLMKDIAGVCESFLQGGIS